MAQRDINQAAVDLVKSYVGIPDGNPLHVATTLTMPEFDGSLDACRRDRSTWHNDCNGRTQSGIYAGTGINGWQVSGIFRASGRKHINVYIRATNI